MQIPLSLQHGPQNASDPEYDWVPGKRCELNRWIKHHLIEIICLEVGLMRLGTLEKFLEA